MPCGIAYIFQVVVLAARAHAALRTRRSHIRPLSCPRNTSLNCTMPALVNIGTGSLPGTSGLDATTVWPCDSKNSRNCCLISLLFISTSFHVNNNECWAGLSTLYALPLPRLAPRYFRYRRSQRFAIDNCNIRDLHPYADFFIDFRQIAFSQNVDFSAVIFQYIGLQI